MRKLLALLCTVPAAWSGHSAAQQAASPPAQPKIICCNDPAGRKVCSDFMPPACQGRAHEERDTKGFIIKRNEAPLTEEQVALRQAEQARKEEEKRKKVEEHRRALAVLATYSSEKDIDATRDRALAEVAAAIAQTKSRLDEANKQKKVLDREREFYKGTAMPPDFKAQLRDNEKELAAQQAALSAKTREIEEIRLKFAAEKKLYLQLTGKGADPSLLPPPKVVTQAAPLPSTAPPTPAAPAGTAPTPSGKPEGKI